MRGKILRLYKMKNGGLYMPTGNVGSGVGAAMHLAIPTGIVRTKTILHTLKYTGFPAWSDREHAPPQDYGKDLIRHIQTEVDAYTFYCDSLPWDGNKETLDSSGDGTKENPWRNMSVALQYLQCLVGSTRYWCDECKPYMKLIVSGVINYSVEVRSLIHGEPTEFTGDFRVILDCEGVAWDLGANVPYAVDDAWPKNLFSQTYIYNLKTTTQHCSGTLSNNCIMYKCKVIRHWSEADGYDGTARHSVQNCIDCIITDPFFYIGSAYNSTITRNGNLPDAAARIVTGHTCSVSLTTRTSLLEAYNCTITLLSGEDYFSGAMKWVRCEVTNKTSSVIYTVSINSLVYCKINNNNYNTTLVIHAGSVWGGEYSGQLAIEADRAIDCQLRDIIIQYPWAELPGGYWQDYILSVNEYAKGCSVKANVIVAAERSGFTSFVGIHVGIGGELINCESSVALSFREKQNNDRSVFAFYALRDAILSKCNGSVDLSYTVEQSPGVCFTACAFGAQYGMKDSVVLHDCTASGNYLSCSTEYYPCLI